MKWSLITALNKKKYHLGAFELSSFKNFIYKEKYRKLTHWKSEFCWERKRSRSFILDLCFAPVLQYYCGDNGYKIWAFFKTLVSKNTATWRLYQTTG